MNSRWRRTVELSIHVRSSIFTPPHSFLPFVNCLVCKFDNMSDIRDILELEQGLASVPSKETIVGGNKVSIV